MPFQARNGSGSVWPSSGLIRGILESGSLDSGGWAEMERTILTPQLYHLLVAFLLRPQGWERETRSELKPPIPRLPPRTRTERGRDPTHLRIAGEAPPRQTQGSLPRLPQSRSQTVCPHSDNPGFGKTPFEGPPTSPIWTPFLKRVRPDSKACARSWRYRHARITLNDGHVFEEKLISAEDVGIKCREDVDRTIGAIAPDFRPTQSASFPRSLVSSSPPALT